MAKIMISLPDDLLARLDAQAAQDGSTRSATIRKLTEHALGSRAAHLGARMVDLEGHEAPRGGNVADAVKAGRPE